MSSSVNNVVVVGGGCAGFPIASKLEASLPPNYRVILIEKRSFFYHTIGGMLYSYSSFPIHSLTSFHNSH
jgi:NADH dehydrogenase FAD-containing subunit